jgi:hypothetical protein
MGQSPSLDGKQRSTELRVIFKTAAELGMQWPATGSHHDSSESVPKGRNNGNRGSRNL